MSLFFIGITIILMTLSACAAVAARGGTGSVGVGGVRGGTGSVGVGGVRGGGGTGKASDMKITPSASSATSINTEVGDTDNNSADTADQGIKYSGIYKYGNNTESLALSDGDEYFDGSEDFTDETNNTGSHNGTGDADFVARQYSFSQADLDAMSRKKIGWGVKLNGSKQPEINQSTRDMLENYNAYYIGEQGETSELDGSTESVGLNMSNGSDKPKELKESVLYLTFDLGYENGYTGMILDVLAEHGVKATFFITGHYLSSQPDIIGRIAAEGHLIANHSLKHTCFPDDSDEKLVSDITGLESAYEEAIGLQMPKILRPPSGEYSERSLAISASLGYATVFWSFAYVDYDDKQPHTADYAYKKITDNLHDGAVILLHTVRPENGLALDRVIEKAWGEGYTFATLDKLCNN